MGAEGDGGEAAGVGGEDGLLGLGLGGGVGGLEAGRRRGWTRRPFSRSPPVWTTLGVLVYTRRLTPWDRQASRM